MASNKYLIAVVGPLLLVFIPACSSNTSAKSVATTHPSVTIATHPNAMRPGTTLAPSQSATATYLRQGGNALISFERGAKPLDATTPPSKDLCSHLLTQLLPTADSRELSSLAAAIPDPIVRTEFVRDIQAKAVYLLDCAKGTVPSNTSTEMKTARDALQRSLTQIGISA